MNSKNGHKDLIVWQKSMELAREVYLLTKEFPKEETYGLVSQMRRAAVSVPSNIAEGSARSTDKSFQQFLSIAYGSALEIETQLLLCDTFGYGDKTKSEKTMETLTEVLKMLNKMTNQKTSD
jgi:four helix bundle protein